MPRRFMCVPLLLTMLTAVVAIPSLAGDWPWPPLSNEELAMKEYAKFPGVHALILKRTVECNDKQGIAREYVRIKVFDTEGKSAGDVQTEEFHSGMKVTSIDARTVRPDGTVVPFNGQVHDKVISKTKGEIKQRKVFNIPDIEPGSIIEYRYEIRWSDNGQCSMWVVQSGIPTKNADFTLIPSPPPFESLRWVVMQLPKNYRPVERNGTVTMSVEDVPAFELEDYSPPLLEILPRVEFTYIWDKAVQTNDYWNFIAKYWYEDIEKFLNKKKVATEELARITSPSDSSEQRLQKIYARAQQLRNLSYERSRTDKEIKKEKLKNSKNIEDVLKLGYGYDFEITQTFIGIARAAGFEATPLWIPERDEYFNHREILDFRRMHELVAVVKLNGKEIYLNPGVPFCPYGLLPWEQTGVDGLLLTNPLNAVWGKTPQPVLQDSMESRAAKLQVSRDGSLEGEVEVTYEGQDALSKRLAWIWEDEAARKKYMEDKLKEWLPTGSTVEIVNMGDWRTTSQTLTVKAKATVPNYGIPSGKRLMLPVSIFPGADRNRFQTAKRVNPIYFPYPYREADDITIKIPEGMQVESLPQPVTASVPFAAVALAARMDGGAVHLRRETALGGYFFKPEHYSQLRAFLDKVKSLGEEQVVLRVAPK